MDLGLFALGAFGAVLTVYLAKQQAIPDFRVVIDIADEENQAAEKSAHIKKTEKDIDDLQEELRQQTISRERAGRLKNVLASSLSELEGERARLRSLESKIGRSKLVSRTIGILLYVVLGGVFGALLGGKIRLEGIDANLPSGLQAVAIGATWTTYLSAVGFRASQGKVQENFETRIEALKAESAAKFDALKRELSRRVEDQVAIAERTDRTETPVLAPQAADLVEDLVQRAINANQQTFDIARLNVEQDVRPLV